MGWFDRLRGREKFASWSVADKAFAAWLTGNVEGAAELVTPYTVLGLSAVIRSVSIISTTIAGLPLRTYERQGDERVRIDSVFDDPYPGIDGLTPFAWCETLLIHLLLWREAFLWHEIDERTGLITAYRPIIPDAFEPVKFVDGKRRFIYTDPGTNEKREVGSERVTYIPGPSLDGIRGHPLLWAARRIFSGALAGDKAASTTLSRGIRLAGLVTPGEGEDIDPTEGEAILQALRPKVLGDENSGDIAFINRRLKLDPWTPTNVESQWHETRTEVLGEIGRIFGIPPHLLNDIEKQTSWGTGVAEQNLGLARYTLRGWSDRIEQVLSMRVAEEEFVEFDYKGLLQGTPAQEIELLIAQKEAGILDVNEVRKILNLGPQTPAQRTAAIAPVAPVVPEPVAAVTASNGHDRMADLMAFMNDRREPVAQPDIHVAAPDLSGLEASVRALAERPEPVVNVAAPEVNVTSPDVHVAAPDMSEVAAAVRSFSEREQAPPIVNIAGLAVQPPDVHVDAPVIHVDPLSEETVLALTRQVAPVVNVAMPDRIGVDILTTPPEPKKRTRVTKRNPQGQVQETETVAE